MILVDSSVWIDFFNGQSTPQTLYLRDEVERHEILVGDLILCEVLQGFRSESDFQKVHQLLLNFPCQNLVGTTVALQSAQNYRTTPSSICKASITISIFSCFLITSILSSHL